MKKRRRSESGQATTESKSRSLRVSVTLPIPIHATLESIAKEKKVSLAWVVRDAAELYINERWPLFRGQQ